MKTTKLFLATLLVSSSLYAGVEKKIALDEVPIKFIEEAKKILPKAEFLSANTETEDDGKVVYEVQGKLEDGRKFEYDVDQKGKVEEIEIEFPLYLVPKAVLIGIEKVYKGFKPTYIEASHSKSMKVTSYEFVGLYDGKEIDIEVSADGRKIKLADN